MGSEAIIVPSLFFTVGYIVWVIVEGMGRRQRLRAAVDFQTKLLDRLGSATEFGQFLASDVGVRFLDSLSVSRDGMPHVRILRAVQGGIVLLFLGLGLFIFAGNVNLPYAPAINVRAIATIFTAAGLGLLLSSVASYALSRRMGLFTAAAATRVPQMIGPQ